VIEFAKTILILMTLLKELHVYRDKKHYFENPFNKDQKVYIFPDVLHCLKNLRNVMDQ